MMRTALIPIGFLLLIVVGFSWLPENYDTSLLRILEEKVHLLSVWQVLFLIGFATFISEDLTCIGTGILAATSALGLEHAILGCYLGILIGDFFLYLTGRYLGKPYLRRRPLSWFLDSATVERSEQWFAKRGAVVIFLTRFLPGSRTATYFVAGALDQPMGLFVLYFSTAALAWAPLVVFLAYIFGREFLDFYQRYSFLALPMVLSGVMIIYACCFALRTVFSQRE